MLFVVEGRDKMPEESCEEEQRQFIGRNRG